MKLYKQIIIISLLLLISISFVYSLEREYESPRSFNPESFRESQHKVDNTPILTHDFNRFRAIIYEEDDSSGDLGDSPSQDTGGSPGGSPPPASSTPTTPVTSNDDEDDLLEEFLRRQEEELESQIVDDFVVTANNLEELQSRLSQEIQLDLNLEIEEENEQTTIRFRDSQGRESIQFRAPSSSINSLSLDNLQIQENTINNRNYMIVQGLHLEDGTKDIRLHRSSQDIISVCIKDTSMSSIEEISETCDEEFEFILECNSQTQFERYSCITHEDYFLITGLEFSGAIEFENTEEEIVTTQVVESTSEEIQLESTVSESSIDLTIIILVVTILLIIFIILGFIILKNKQNKLDSKSNYNTKIELNFTQEEYNAVKNYLFIHKNTYKIEDLKNALIQQGYDKELIEEVIMRENF